MRVNPHEEDFKTWFHFRLNARALFLLLASLASIVTSPPEVRAQTAPSSVWPKWTVALKSYGWTPPKSQSDKVFFKDFSLAKLEALDPSTRISFVDDDTVVVYHTKQEGQDWRRASRQLEAFFISAKDGSLSNRREWPGSIRGSGSDLLDSESRLVPLSNGRFLVLADHVMMLYGSGLILVKQKSLEPSAWGDLWSAQSVDGGHKIFLRHQSLADQQTTYYWLTSDTLHPLAQMPGFRGPNYSVVATAGDNFVLTVLGFSQGGMTTGIGRVGIDGSKEIICSDQFCREAGGLTVVSSQRTAVSGRHGIGLVDPERGLIWSKRILPSENPNEFQFGGMRSDTSGTRFAFWMTSYRKTVFDGVKVGSSPTLLLYDANTPKLLVSIPIELKTGDFDFALSPDGRQVAIFDGARIRLYVIN